MSDLSKKDKARIERELEKIVATRHSQMADILTDNSQYAYAEGDKQAQKNLRVALNTQVVQKESIAYMKEYGKLLKSNGAIMIPVYGKIPDGADELLGYTKYSLMSNSAKYDTKGIMDIITKEYKAGTPTGLKQSKKGTYPKGSVAEKMNEHFHKMKSHASLVSRTEMARITDQGQRIRYQKLGITQARWKTSDDERVRPAHLAREEHGVYDMDKIPSLGEPNCRCSIVPVLDTEKKPVITPPVTPPDTPSREDLKAKLKDVMKKNPLTKTKVDADEESMLKRTLGGTRYTPEQARQKVIDTMGASDDYLKRLDKNKEDILKRIHEKEELIKTLRGNEKRAQQRMLTGQYRLYRSLVDDMSTEVRSNTKRAREVLFNDKPNNMISIIGQNGDPLPTGSSEKIFKKLKEGEEFVKNIVSPKLTPGKKPHSIGYHKINTKRAYSRANEIYIHDDNPVETIVHECGHTIEHYMGAYDSSDVDWYEKVKKHMCDRTADEKFASLKELTGINYPPSEFAKRDQFYSPYMGKMYGSDSMAVCNSWGVGLEDTRATEFISMSIQMMYEDPIRFALFDPESFKMAFALLKGL